MATSISLRWSHDCGDRLLNKHSNCMFLCLFNFFTHKTFFRLRSPFQTRLWTKLQVVRSLDKKIERTTHRHENLTMNEVVWVGVWLCLYVFPKKIFCWLKFVPKKKSFFTVNTRSKRFDHFNLLMICFAILHRLECVCHCLLRWRLSCVWF